MTAALMRFAPRPLFGGSTKVTGRVSGRHACLPKTHELWEGVGRSARLHGTTAADDARLGVNPMKSSNHRVGSSGWKFGEQNNQPLPNG